MKKIVSSRTEYPHLTCYWTIDWDGIPFSAYEVTGLKESLDYIYYRAGNQGNNFDSQPVSKPGGTRITIKWGVFSSDAYGAHIFHNWRDERVHDPDEDSRINILIIHTDENGNGIIKWNCKGCKAIEYVGPTLKADESEIAMQSLVLSVEELRSEII